MAQQLGVGHGVLALRLEVKYHPVLRRAGLLDLGHDLAAQARQVYPLQVGGQGVGFCLANEQNVVQQRDHELDARLDAFVAFLALRVGHALVVAAQ